LSTKSLILILSSIILTIIAVIILSFSCDKNEKSIYTPPSDSTPSSDDEALQKDVVEADDAITPLEKTDSIEITDEPKTDDKLPEARQSDYSAIFDESSGLVTMPEVNISHIETLNLDNLILDTRIPADDEWIYEYELLLDMNRTLYIEIMLETFIVSLSSYEDLDNLRKDNVVIRMLEEFIEIKGYSLEPMMQKLWSKYIGRFYWGKYDDHLENVIDITIPQHDWYSELRPLDTENCMVEVVRLMTDYTDEEIMALPDYELETLAMRLMYYIYDIDDNNVNNTMEILNKLISGREFYYNPNLPN